VSDPLFGAMLQSIIDGAPDKAAELARQALANGVDPLEAVNREFAVGITFAGDQFACGQMYLPDLLASAEAMKAAINILEPEMLSSGDIISIKGITVLGRTPPASAARGREVIAKPTQPISLVRCACGADNGVR
jgi:trimethylamine corrinoid protein